MLESQSENNQTLSEKMAALQEMVEWFESDDFDIELAIDHYKEAEKLADEINEDLKNLRNEVTVLKKKFA